MSKKYKKIQGDQSAAHNDGQLAAMAATASEDDQTAEALSMSKPASHAVESSNSGKEGAAINSNNNNSLPQQLLMSLHIDHTLFRPWGIKGGDDNDAAEQDGGHDQAVNNQQQQATNSGGGASNCGADSDFAHSRPISPMPFPLLSLQQSPLRGVVGDAQAGGGGASGDHDRAHDAKQPAAVVTLSASPIQKGITLTRAFSTPESRDKYPNDNSNNDDHHHIMDLRQAATTEDDLLKQAYPLSLQRSASSAFGSPEMGKFKCTRSHSNSGNSDPGASAFHPVWSSKSLSTSSAGSDHSRSEVGASTHSAPVGDHRSKLRKNTSPWRRVMARMKKGTSGGSGKGAFRRQLSGRENPARPHLSEDEMTSPVKDLLTLSPGGDGDASAAATTSKPVAVKHGTHNIGSGSKGSKVSNKQIKKDIVSRKKSLSSNSCKEVQISETKKEPSRVSKEKKELLMKPSPKTYNDPGLALDLSMSDDDGDDDNTIEPIMGKFTALNEVNHIQSGSRPPSLDITPQLTKNGHFDDGHQHPPPTSIEVPCDSVEVIHRPSNSADGRTTHVMEDTAFGSHSVQVFSLPATSMEGNSPPKVERMTIEESSEDHDNFPYHPLGSVGDRQNAAAYPQLTASQVPTRLKFRSPQRNEQHMATTSLNSNNVILHNRSPSCTSSNNSPDSRLSSMADSPPSRISSSNSGANKATTISGDRIINTHPTEGSPVVDGADFEVREANRRSDPLRGLRTGIVETNQEVLCGPDGGETVVSASTTSSNYHGYISSPRPLRDGATVPFDRFFAGGNVVMSPSPQQRVTMDQSLPPLPSRAPAVSPNISKFITLNPKKSFPASNAGGASVINARDTTHSPHTVSSNSVSANSSSSSETKKPLKFVAYEIQEESETGSPYDEPPPNSMIRPRISIAGRHHTIDLQESQRRPPMVQRALGAGYDPRKPPQSPRKQDYGRFASGARTPTRTPPPSSAYKDTFGSGANTPCSPPVIIDGPNVLCGALSTKPTRPYVVRRGGRGMFLMPPSSASSYRPPHPRAVAPHPAMSTAASASATVAATSSPPRDNCLTVVEGGRSDGAQEIMFDTVEPAFIEGEAGSTAATVSPEKYAVTRRLHNIAPLNKKTDFKDYHATKGDVVAIVSPEKGF